MPEENNEQFCKRMLNAIKSKTNIKLNENMYRIEKQLDTQDKPKPLKMELSKPELKHVMFKCRSEFKGKNVFTENLTKFKNITSNYITLISIENTQKLHVWLI